MSESLLSPPPAGPDEPEAALPPPSRPRGPMSLVVLATLAVGYTLWAAQDIILPVLLAMFFALVGNPILRLLQKLWIPRALGALLILGAGLGVTGSLAVQLGAGSPTAAAQGRPPGAGPDQAGAAGQPGGGKLRPCGRW